MILKENRPLELLVVEDNPGDVLLLKEYLGLSLVPVHNILQAGSIKEVAGIIKNKEVDLAFLDLTLPDSEGIYSFILLNMQLPHTPIIVLTGISDINVALEALSLGAQDYVMKNDFNEKLLSKSIQYSIERKRMMEKLRESNERYEIMAMATNDVIWDWDIETGKISRNKEGVKNVYGFENNDEIDTIDKWLLHIHPDDLEYIKQFIKDVYAPGNGNSFTTEYRFRRPDGVYNYVYDRCYVLRDESGKATRMIGAAQNITANKLAEKELQDINEQLRSLSAHLQNVREEEQSRIAREIHDELGQQITGLKMDIAWLRKKLVGNSDPESLQEKLSSMNELLDETVRSIRKISSQLRPSILDDLGLPTALEWQSREFEKRFRIPVRFQTSIKELEIPTLVATVFFRIYQESLTNVARHAEAKNITSVLELKNKRLTLTITDDGKGFNLKGKAKTLGLLGMKERALMVGGELEIKTKPGKGTSVLISVAIS